MNLERARAIFKNVENARNKAQMEKETAEKLSQERYDAEKRESEKKAELDYNEVVEAFRKRGMTNLFDSLIEVNGSGYVNYSRGEKFGDSVALVVLREHEWEEKRWDEADISGIHKIGLFVSILEQEQFTSDYAADGGTYPPDEQGEYFLEEYKCNERTSRHLEEKYDLHFFNRIYRIQKGVHVNGLLVGKHGNLEDVIEKGILMYKTL
jgi:hypothetical protein